jgi:hypothetical protein
MKTIIAGCRDFTDYSVLEEVIRVTELYKKITEVVSGVATGVDALGERWATENNIPIKKYVAYWKKFGYAAGPIRNKQMAKYADGLLAIWDGKSPGTKNMIRIFGELNGWDNVIVYMIPTKSLIIAAGQGLETILSI